MVFNSLDVTFLAVSSFNMVRFFMLVISTLSFEVGSFRVIIRSWGQIIVELVNTLEVTF